MAAIDRRGAFLSATDAPSSSTPNPDLAIKTAVRVVATSAINIQTFGLGTIDGVALAAGDRVLLTAQADATQNGIYNASTGVWAASSDFQNNSQIAQGLAVFVGEGTLNALSAWHLTSPNPIILGTSALTFSGALNFSGLTTVTVTNSIGAVSTDGLTLRNVTAAAPGAQQWSPRLHWSGVGYKTNAPAGPQTVDWIAEIQPVQNTISPNNTLIFSAQTAGAGYIPIVGFSIVGSNQNTYIVLNAPSGKNVNLIYQNNAASVWYLQNNAGATNRLDIINSDANSNATLLSLTQSGALSLNGGPLTVTPTTATYNRGMLVSIPNPSTAGGVGPYAYNQIDVTHQSTVTGAGLDAFGLLNSNADAFRSNLTIAQGAGGTPIANMLVATRVTATSGTFSDIVGFGSGMYLNVALTGTFFEASNPAILIDASGALTGSAVTQEVDAGINSGGSATNRIALAAVNTGAAQGTTRDYAIALSNGGASGGAFQKGIALTNLWSANQPIASTGDFIYSDTAYTLANFANLGNLTITGNILAFPNIGIAGNGNATFGIPIGSLAASLNVEISGTSKGIVGFAVSTNSTTGFSKIAAINSTTGVEIDILANEANRTATFLGQTTGNWGEIISSGNGLLVGTVGSVPIVMGTNSLESGRWSTTQGELDLGVNATAAGALKVYGATQGSVIFKVAANVNANSTITWPNGTTDFSATGGASQVVKQTSAGAAFTVAQLAAADLSNGTTGSGGGVVLATSPTLTTPSITTSATLSNNGIGNTSTDGFVVQNTTAAAAGAQQWSPRIHWIGRGWQTTTPQSEATEWIAEIQETQNSTHPNNNLVFSAQVNAGGFVPIVTFAVSGGAGAGNSSLIFNAASTKNANLVYQDGAANVWYVQNNAGATDTYTIINSDANGNATAMTISQARAVAFPGVGTTASAANAFLDNAASNNLLRSTSSLAYKKDVEPLDPAIALRVLNGGKPIWYRSLAAADNPAWSWYGLGAEDVAALDPRLVHYGYRDEDFEQIDLGADADGPRYQCRLKAGATLKPDSVQYDRFVPHLLTGWQGHEARIAALEAKLAAH